MWILILSLACSQAPQSGDLPLPVQQAMAQDSSQELGKGRKAFRQHCHACHGQHAQGDGPAASALSDTPGALAITTRDADRLLRTIRRGVPSTAMQGYSSLAEEDLEAMAAWLASLGPPAAAPGAE